MNKLGERHKNINHVYSTLIAIVDNTVTQAQHACRQLEAANAEPYVTNLKTKLKEKYTYLHGLVWIAAYELVEVGCEIDSRDLMDFLNTITCLNPNKQETWEEFQAKLEILAQEATE